MYGELSQLLAPNCIKLNEPMQKHTTFKIGGPVDALVTPTTVGEIKAIKEYCHQNQLPLLVFGLGSNLLVTDKGLRGVAIKIGKNFNTVQVSDQEIYAQAGIRLSELARRAAKLSFTGMEFAEGIPGSLGGAVVMNAGAYGGEMQSVVWEVETLNDRGVTQVYSIQECEFSYRSSIFMRNGDIVLAARLRFGQGDRDAINRTMQEYARQRREKQPLEYPSAGSVFKRPAGLYVGPMIEELGLKGFRIGGAEVSVKHAGFIVNRGGAKASDVLDLIKIIQQKALERFGVELQTEIRVVGEL